MKINLRHFLLMLVATLVVEFVVISYNHFTGFLQVSGFAEFVFRLLIGTLLAYFPAMVLFVVNVKAVWFLNRELPWETHFTRRLPVELGVVVITSAILATLITLLAHTLAPYREGLTWNLINNILITTAINLLIVTLIEAWYYFLNWRDSAVNREKLEASLAQARFDSLRNQVNPHFLFNSLNVLSVLVKKDAVMAEKFIGEFARIYRYVLETNDKQVITVKEELEFARSYLFLQQIRYGDGLNYHFDVSADVLNRLVVPLSMQLLMENAIKHNVISSIRQLTISVISTPDAVVVRNTYQPKAKQEWSAGVGLKNLTARYALLAGCEPVFGVEDADYVAVLPLIPDEE